MVQLSMNRFGYFNMCEGVSHAVIDIDLNKEIYGVFTKIDDITFKFSQGEGNLYMTILGKSS